MRSKNYEEPCISRFCAVNQAVATQTERVEVAAPRRQTKLVPANADSIAGKFIAIDQSEIIKDRELRESIEARRHKEAQAHQRYQFNISQTRMTAQMKRVVGQIDPQQYSAVDNAATKLRLAMVLPALQNMGLEYRFISETVEACFKGQDVDSDRNLSVIYSFLVYGKEELVDSATCYANAIRGVSRTTTTNYAAVTPIVMALVEIAKDFTQVLMVAH